MLCRRKISAFLTTLSDLKMFVHKNYPLWSKRFFFPLKSQNTSLLKSIFASNQKTRLKFVIMNFKKFTTLKILGFWMSGQKTQVKKHTIQIISLSIQLKNCSLNVTLSMTLWSLGKLLWKGKLEGLILDIWENIGLKNTTFWQSTSLS